MRARTRWVAGLAAAAILLTATTVAVGYNGQVEAIVGVAHGTITCGKPFTLTATILDDQGAPLAGLTVDWSFVTTQSADDTINKTPTVTNAQGKTTTTVSLAPVSGERQVRATAKLGDSSASGEASASGVVDQTCHSLPRTDTLSPAAPQDAAPLAAVLALVLAFAAGGWLTLRRLAATSR